MRAIDRSSRRSCPSSGGSILRCDVGLGRRSEVSPEIDVRVVAPSSRRSCRCASQRTVSPSRLEVAACCTGPPSSPRAAGARRRCVVVEAQLPCGSRPAPPVAPWSISHRPDLQLREVLRIAVRGEAGERDGDDEQARHRRCGVGDRCSDHHQVDELVHRHRFERFVVERDVEDRLPAASRESGARGWS